MSKKYKPVRMPREAYDNFMRKKTDMERAIKELTGKNVRIPLTNIFKAVSKKQIFFGDGQIVKLVKRRRR